MQRNMTIITSLTVFAALSGAIGCSSTSGPTPSTSVSFKNDVMPIFHQSCTISSSCHGQMMNSAEANLYLGNNFMEGDNTSATIAATYAGLVGVKSVEKPAMNLVTAKDPANSYLFHKVNDDQATLNGLACSGGMCPAGDCDMTMVCGIPMPKSGTTLMSADLATINNWITQGALNN
jgi:hypothetical protein